MEKTARRIHPWTLPRFVPILRLIKDFCKTPARTDATERVPPAEAKNGLFWQWRDDLCVVHPTVQPGPPARRSLSTNAGARPFMTFIEGPFPRGPHQRSGRGACPPGYRGRRVTRPSIVMTMEGRPPACPLAPRARAGVRQICWTPGEVLEKYGVFAVFIVSAPIQPLPRVSPVRPSTMIARTSRDARARQA